MNSLAYICGLMQIKREAIINIYKESQQQLPKDEGNLQENSD